MTLILDDKYAATTNQYLMSSGDMYRTNGNAYTYSYGYKPYPTLLSVPALGSNNYANYPFTTGTAPSVGIVAGDEYRTLFVHLNNGDGTDYARLFDKTNWTIDSPLGVAYWASGVETSAATDLGYHGLNFEVINDF